MKLFLFIFIAFCSASPLFGQESDIRDALVSSGAETVFVGKAVTYGRTYSEDQSAYIDGTFATFRVLNVLKGKITDKTVEVRLAGHWGFGRENWIVFVSTDVTKVVKDRKIGRCERFATTPVGYFRIQRKITRQLGNR